MHGLLDVVSLPIPSMCCHPTRNSRLGHLLRGRFRLSHMGFLRDGLAPFLQDHPVNPRYFNQGIAPVVVTSAQRLTEDQKAGRCKEKASKARCE